jgi:hypothetical protein
LSDLNLTVTTNYPVNYICVEALDFVYSPLDLLGSWYALACAHFGYTIVPKEKLYTMTIITSIL